MNLISRSDSNQPGVRSSVKKSVIRESQFSYLWNGDKNDPHPPWLVYDLKIE